MLGVFERFCLALAAALVTYGVVYLSYRKTSAAFWGYVSVWLTELPLFIVFITGVQRAAGFELFVHTLGIPVMAALLAIADILLIEIALVGALNPLKFLLPQQFSALFKLQDIIVTLQKYHAIPKPERVVRVFAASVIGGLIDFAILFLFGAF